MAVAQVLLQAPGVVDAVLELVAQRVLLALESLVARIAYGGIGIDPAIGVVGQRSAGW